MTAPLCQTTGRRKRSVARVRFTPGSGAVTVNADEAHWIYNPGGNVTVDLDGHEAALCFSSSSVARLAA